MNSLVMITALAMTTGHGGKACGGAKMMKHHKARATCVAVQAPIPCGTMMAYASPTMAPAPMVGGSPQMSPASPQAVPPAPPVPMATPGGAPPAPPKPSM